MTANSWGAFRAYTPTYPNISLKLLTESLQGSLVLGPILLFGRLPKTSSPLEGNGHVLTKGYVVVVLYIPPEGRLFWFFCCCCPSNLRSVELVWLSLVAAEFRYTRQSLRHCITPSTCLEGPLGLSRVCGAVLIPKNHKNTSNCSKRCFRE